MKNKLWLLVQQRNLVVKETFNLVSKDCEILEALRIWYNTKKILLLVWNERSLQYVAVLQQLLCRGFKAYKSIIYGLAAAPNAETGKKKSCITNF